MPPPDGAVPADALHALIHRRLICLGHRDDPDVQRLVSAVHRRHRGHVAAVLLYGSYLRGKRDTLLDLYVLLSDLSGALPALQAAGNRALPPNVYHLSLPAEDDRPALRAKYATLTVWQFQRAMGDFHSYFWSRFTQPAGLVEAASADVERRVVDALAAATNRFAAEVAPLMKPAEFTAEAFWHRGLALTYACELRSESPEGVADLYASYGAHFRDVLATFAGTPGAAVDVVAPERYRARTGRSGASARVRWAVRRLQGKVLSVLRLVKAAATFDDPLDYLLWKIQRHSGIYIAPTERQRRYPLIFAWGLLWRLYRRGAFR